MQVPWTQGCCHVVIQAFTTLLPRMVQRTSGQTRLNGGSSDNGGLANVNHNTPSNRNNNLGFRPLDLSSAKRQLRPYGAVCGVPRSQPPSILPISTSRSAACPY